MAVEIKIQPILPKRRNYPLDLADKLEAEIERVMRGEIRSTLVNAFFTRMRGWKERPDITGTFNRRVRLGNLTGFSLFVTPSGRHKRLWTFVTLGVKAHPIAAKRMPKLRVKGGVGGYRPRTARGDYYGGPGDYDNAGTFWTKSVQHPGIEAREFEKEIAKKHKDRFKQLIEQAAKRAMR